MTHTAFQIQNICDEQELQRYVEMHLSRRHDIGYSKPLTIADRLELVDVLVKDYVLHSAGLYQLMEGNGMGGLSWAFITVKHQHVTLLVFGGLKRQWKHLLQLAVIHNEAKHRSTVHSFYDDATSCDLKQRVTS